MGVITIDVARILGNFKILSNLVPHIFTRTNAIAFDPVLEFLQSTVGSESAYDLITYTKEDTDETSSHRKMIVLKGIPFRFGLDDLRS